MRTNAPGTEITTISPHEGTSLGVIQMPKLSLHRLADIKEEFMATQGVECIIFPVREDERERLVVITNQLTWPLKD